MRALVFGVEPEPSEEPADGNALLAALAHTPMRLMEVADPGFLLPDWVVCKPRLTGICGSDAKQVFMDWGEVDADNPMIDFSWLWTSWRSVPRPRDSRSGSGSCSIPGFPALRGGCHRSARPVRQETSRCAGTSGPRRSLPASTRERRRTPVVATRR